MGIVFLVIFILPLYVAFQWYKWLKEDSPENTKSVVTWMRICFFLAAIGNALSLLNIFNKEVTAVQSPIMIIINAVVNTFFSWYFYNVTKRYNMIKHNQ